MFPIICSPNTTSQKKRFAKMCFSPFPTWRLSPLPRPPLVPEVIRAISTTTTKSLGSHAIPNNFRDSEDLVLAAAARQVSVVPVQSEITDEPLQPTSEPFLFAADIGTRSCPCLVRVDRGKPGLHQANMHIKVLHMGVRSFTTQFTGHSLCRLCIVPRTPPATARTDSHRARQTLDSTFFSSPTIESDGHRHFSAHSQTLPRSPPIQEI